MLVANNIKVERITRKKYKPKYVPVNPDLMDLLIEMGYNELKGSDLHILEPLRTSSSKTIMNCLSRGFSHYYKQAFPERRTVQFKVLRKTYLSYLNRELGDKMIDLSSHAGMDVLQNHYIDQELVARGLKMRMFE
jgi:hypothetical protein